MAQQTLKPKLISCCSKCSIVSLSVGTSAANPEEKKKKPQPAELKTGIDGSESIKALLLFSPASPRLRACAQQVQSLIRSVGALPCCSGCQAWGHAATGAGAGFHHHWQGSWFLPKLFMSFPRLAALCPTESSRPFTLCFPTCITDLDITLPALLAVSLALGASLGLFVLISNFPAKSLLR